MRAPLGQHFLTSKAALKALSSAIPLSKGVSVVEVGPGKGALTAYLLQTGASVLAIERDASFLPKLRDQFADAVASGQLRVINHDIRDRGWLKHVSGPYDMVANIPYYLTNTLLRHALSSDRPPRAIAFMVQKEIAERVVERDGKSSLLSLSVRLFGEPRLLKTIPKTAFSPQPAVASAILTITDIHAPKKAVQEHFFALITTAFREKRKQVGKKFADHETISELLRQQKVRATSRAEEIPFSVWYAIAKQMGES